LGNAAKRIQVDKTLTNGDIRSTAMSIRMKPSGITLISVPLDPKRKGQPGYEVDRGQLAELIGALRKDTMAEYVKAHPPR
jgi:hypothetical protein